MGYAHLLGSIGPILYWASVLLTAVVSLCAAVVAMRLASRIALLVSAATLALGLLLVAVPVHHAPALFTALLALVALALAVIGGGPAVLTVLSLATQGSTSPGTHGGIVVDGDSPHPGTEVLRGGTTIGLVERLAVAGAIIGGFPSAIAVVVAVKGVGRFSELNAAESRERFIIGTLVSLVWACACAALVYFAAH